VKPGGVTRDSLQNAKERRADGEEKTFDRINRMNRTHKM
jgi:hypothetical protein